MMWGRNDVKGRKTQGVSINPIVLILSKCSRPCCPISSDHSNGGQEVGHKGQENTFPRKLFSLFFYVRTFPHKPAFLPPFCPQYKMKITWVQPKYSSLSRRGRGALPLPDQYVLTAMSPRGAATCRHPRSPSRSRSYHSPAAGADRAAPRVTSGVRV